ncbi:hypothetical protein V1515DRAFT_581879 [Lipomyces mesembrius]
MPGEHPKSVTEYEKEMRKLKKEIDEEVEKARREQEKELRKINKDVSKLRLEAEKEKSKEQKDYAKEDKEIKSFQKILWIVVDGIRPLCTQAKILDELDDKADVHNDEASYLEEKATDKRMLSRREGVVDNVDENDKDYVPESVTKAQLQRKVNDSSSDNDDDSSDHDHHLQPKKQKFNMTTPITPYRPESNQLPKPSCRSNRIPTTIRCDHSLSVSCESLFFRELSPQERNRSVILPSSM